MLAIVGLFVFGGLAIRTNRLIARDRALFTEFSVPVTLGTWVWLFPVPAALALLPVPAVTRVLFGFAVATLFFVPGLAAAFNTRRLFETAGTDRVDPAQRIASEVILAGVIGIAVALAWCLLYWLYGGGITRT